MWWWCLKNKNVVKFDFGWRSVPSPFLLIQCFNFNVRFGSVHSNRIGCNNSVVAAGAKQQPPSSSSSYGVLFQSVAVSTMWRQSARPEAFLHAEEGAMFRGLRPASTERNQVWLGLPAGLLQTVYAIYTSGHAKLCTQGWRGRQGGWQLYSYFLTVLAADTDSSYVSGKVLLQTDCKRCWRPSWQKTGVRYRVRQKKYPPKDFCCFLSNCAKF